jgi:hypothetical protein
LEALPENILTPTDICLKVRGKDRQNFKQNQFSKLKSATFSSYLAGSHSIQYPHRGH